MFGVRPIYIGPLYCCASCKTYLILLEANNHNASDIGRHGITEKTIAEENMGFGKNTGHWMITYTYYI